MTEYPTTLFEGQEGNIILKPGHILVIGKDGFAQVPMPVREKTHLIEEYGSISPIRFRTSPDSTETFPS